MNDGSLLADAVEKLHPEPFRSVSRERFFDQAERAETTVELMELLALLGERNGHTAIHPLDEHVRPLHLAPVVLYEFEDGVFIVAAEAPSIVGREILTIEGVPIEELNHALKPLVARDNEWTIRARRPVFAVTAEVLAGLGILRGPWVTMVARTPALAPHVLMFEPVTAAEYLARVGRGDRLPNAGPDQRVDRTGRAVHVSYHVTRGETTEFAREIEAAGAGAERVVLDLRWNSGGNNQTYQPLLGALERLEEAGTKLVVLTSRVTFSAAMQLVVDLELRTSAVFVGEPTGGSPNQYGDAQPVELPEAGLTAKVATVSWTTAGEKDARVTKEPDVSVPLTASAWFAGEDPVLRAALEV